MELSIQWNKIFENAQEYGGLPGVKRIIEKSIFTRETKDTLFEIAKKTLEGKNGKAD